ncbi:hypothetical protein CXF70_12500 [Planomicrobium sp. MB-3u-38]|nr:hypothetical protein CXF70_12500 [Planomicrobium sp. MB-3u-38]
MAPAISREEHSSYCFAEFRGAPALREFSKDMKQNSADFQVIYSLQASRKAKLFCGISFIKILKIVITNRKVVGI